MNIRLEGGEVTGKKGAIAVPVSSYVSQAALRSIGALLPRSRNWEYFSMVNVGPLGVTGPCEMGLREKCGSGLRQVAAAV
jgi:hypothetical protein